MTDPRRIPVGKRPPIPNWIVADLTARDALRYRWQGAPITSDDVGCVCRVGTVAPFAYYVLESIGPLVWSPIGGSSGVSYGTTADTACEGNDARLSDARQLAAGADKTKLDELPDAATLASALAGKADAAGTTTALAGKADIAVERGFKAVRPIAGSDTPTLADRGGLIRSTAAAPSTLTVPTNVGVAYGDANALTYCFTGAGLATFAPFDVTVTLIPPVGRTLVVAAHESGKCRWVQLTQLSANEWAMSGDLAEG